MVLTILRATLVPTGRRSGPRSYPPDERSKKLVIWLETLAVDYRLIGVQRFIFATIFIWPIVDIVHSYIFISDVRHIIHSLSHGTDMQNEWSVGQVAAVLAWLPLLTQITVLGYNCWKSHCKSPLLYVDYIYINPNSLTHRSLRL